MVTSRALMYQTWYPFNVSTSPTFEIIQITQVIATFRISALSFALLHLYANLVCIACTQLHKIKDALLHVKQKDMEPEYNKGDGIPTEGDEQRMQNEVKDIVRHHQQVFRYLQTMQDYTNSIIGGILLFLMLMTCTAAFTAVLNLGDTTDMTQSIMVYVGAMCVAFVYCGFGTLLADTFDSVRHAAWNSDWVGTPVTYQKSISFIIMISIKGFELKAWKVVSVSNSTFMSSRAVASWSKASCLGLALRNARWFESSWGKKFSHEILAIVWDRCPPSIVMHLGSYDR
ncbi:hypothetical protein ANN_17322 [Periplaneta americana]|uniref:Odorant receptor n=1 Tax=Periplaneta americana TaxID=6978 RepID=A0ABQ8SSL7_PERAM|nr:hypothetical protein ANN_17322 [Periplaneta americana]